MVFRIGSYGYSCGVYRTSLLKVFIEQENKSFQFFRRRRKRDCPLQISMLVSMTICRLIEPEIKVWPSSLKQTTTF